jgi:integrase
MWRLIASRGLRRGEGCGLRRTDTDLRAAITSIRWQITQLGWETAQGVPKSDAGERQVALDADTVADIRAHRQRQQKEKDEAGDDWTDSGFEFTNPDGTPLHPATVTDAFELIAYLAGLPPIRLHDLRHGAATLLQMSRVASDATFGGSRERALPAVQRATPGQAPDHGSLCTQRDLGCHHSVAPSRTMMQPVRLHQIRG